MRIIIHRVKIIITKVYSIKNLTIFSETSTQIWMSIINSCINYTNNFSNTSNISINFPNIVGIN